MWGSSIACPTSDGLRHVLVHTAPTISHIPVLRTMVLRQSPIPQFFACSSSGVLLGQTLCSSSGVGVKKPKTGKRFGRKPEHDSVAGLPKWSGSAAFRKRFKSGPGAGGFPPPDDKKMGTRLQKRAGVCDSVVPETARPRRGRSSWGETSKRFTTRTRRRERGAIIAQFG